jgi:spore maturation protein CgeB
MVMKSLNIYCCLIVEEESNLWHRQFTETLRDLGHTVFTPKDLGLRESWFLMGAGSWNKQHQEKLSDKILSDVKDKHKNNGIDLFFCYLYPFQFRPELFTHLSSLSIPAVYFFCDNFAYPEVASKYAPLVTLNWVPERDAVEQFKKSGSCFIHLPMAANPKYSYPISMSEDVNIAFLGSKNSYRRNILGKVIKSGINLRVYGDGWNPKARSYHELEFEKTPASFESTLSLTDKIIRYAKFKAGSLSQTLSYGLLPRINNKKYALLGIEYDKILESVSNSTPLSEPEANKVFSRSKVIIGINDQFNPLKKDPIVIYSKLRDFEAPMAGACYLAQSTPDQSGIFDIDKEIMTYNSVDELIDKANFLLGNTSFRTKLRSNARERSLRDHRWANRFNQIFASLGIG